MEKTVPLGSVYGTLTPPCSKSYAQRALASALLAGGISTLHNIGFCDDTHSTLQCIQALGAQVAQTHTHTLRIEGGLRTPQTPLYIGESGLAARMFTPIASLCSTPVTITGHGSVLHRPMQMMADALRALGAQVQTAAGHLPFVVCGPIRGGDILIDGSISSQFLTGLLLALPLAQADTTIRVKNPVSTPYIDMTIDTAAHFGVEICHNNYEEFFIEGNRSYEPAQMHIEGDWSAAAMLLVAGATTGEVCVSNISTLSKQADTAICDALERSGAGLICEAQSITASKRPLRAFEFDATHCPDLFPALAALAAASEGESILHGTRRLQYKESARAESIREEYAKLGIEVDLSQPNLMKIRGGRIRPARVHSHGDHRIAMSLAVAALRSEGTVVIEDAGCVAKSYPDFFQDLDKLRSR